jgi:hypothetical protein
MQKFVEYHRCILPDNPNLYLKYVSVNELVFHKIVNVIPLSLDVVTISVTCEICHCGIYLKSNIKLNYPSALTLPQKGLVNLDP